jgi:hypothetical protein
MSVTDLFSVCFLFSSLITSFHENRCSIFSYQLHLQDDGSSLLSTLVAIAFAAVALLFLKGFLGKFNQSPITTSWDFFSHRLAFSSLQLHLRDSLTNAVN